MAKETTVNGRLGNLRRLFSALTGNRGSSRTWR